MDHQELSECPEFTRAFPAPEKELLICEASRETSSTPRVRVLANLEARVHGKAAAVPQAMLDQQSFAGLTFVGITASLHGLDGLFAQCAWFDNDDIDWFWVEVTDVRSIELRRDPRFRGGTPCLWMVTEFAEYAMMTSHVLFDESWEFTLEYFGAPRCDMWPQKGVRPEWWPVHFAQSWPYDRSTRELYAALMAEDPLAVLAQNLSLQSTSLRKTWLRLGPKGDVQQPGRPLHHLSQMSEWVLAPDAGLRKTRKEENPDEDGNAMEASGKAKRKGRRPSRERASKRRL